MSLSKTLAACDEAALAALASAGLLRRAKAAKPGAIRIAGETAFVEIDGHQTEIGPKGLKAARCSCPATGICLHLLAAVLALRAAAPEAPEAPEAATEICALPESALAEYAGAEWSAALRLALEGAPADLEASGASAQILAPDLGHPVTFLAGAGLRGAIWKGPESRRRLAVATAALVLRKARGIAPQALPDPLQEAGFAPGFLEAAAAAVEAAAPAFLSGAGDLAAARLTELALTARIQAAPRLAGSLLLVARLAAEPEGASSGARRADLLEAAGRASARIHALKARPGDLRLKGRLRRIYAPSEPLAPLWLGARIWKDEQGGRGLRFYGYDRASARWISASFARPGGLDPSFDPWAEYRRLVRSRFPMGRRLIFAAPQISEDGALAPDLPGEPAPDSGEPLPVQEDWADLLSALDSDFGAALARSGRRIPLLLRPARIGELRSGAAPGEWRLRILDRQGRALDLTLDRDPGSATLAQDGGLLLAEASEARRRLRLTLVSAIQEGAAPRVWNAGLDSLPPELLRLKTAPEDLRGDALADLAADLFFAAAEIALGRAPEPSLRGRAEALGLKSAAGILAAAPSPAAALRLGFCAAELEWRISLSYGEGL